jgi:hypothetical protein
VTPGDLPAEATGALHQAADVGIVMGATQGKRLTRRAVLRATRRFTALVIAVTLTTMAGHLRDRLDGEHLFRQAHVAANIEKYAANGLSLRPQTFNRDTPRLVYDFPAYQLLAALLARATGAAPLLTGRALSLVLFALCCLGVARLLRDVGAGWLHGMLALLFFAWSPLNLYYFRAPLADTLAIAAAITSLAAFVSWERTGAELAFALAAAAGFLATLVKCPVYLPFFLAILWSLVSPGFGRARSWPRSLAFVGAIAAGFATFKVYSNVMNESATFISGAEVEEYIARGMRLSPRQWGPLASGLARQLVDPVAGLFALAGLLALLRGPRREAHRIFAALLAGSLLTLLLFFDKNRWHSYYQLPYVLGVAYFAGAGARGLIQRLASLFPNSLRMPVRLTALSLVLGLSAWASVMECTRLSTNRSSAEIAAAGEWIRTHTTAGDFVVYIVTSDPDWNPAYLYFAKRDGYDLFYDDVEPAILGRIRTQHAGDHARFLVFCPDGLVSPLAPSLARLPLTLIGRGSPGALYRVGEL